MFKQPIQTQDNTRLAWWWPKCMLLFSNQLHIDWLHQWPKMLLWIWFPPILRTRYLSQWLPLEVVFLLYHISFHFLQWPSAQLLINSFSISLTIFWTVCPIERDPNSSTIRNSLQSHRQHSLRYQARSVFPYPKGSFQQLQLLDHLQLQRSVYSWIYQHCSCWWIFQMLLEWRYH